MTINIRKPNLTLDDFRNEAKSIQDEYISNGRPKTFEQSLEDVALRHGYSSWSQLYRSVSYVPRKRYIPFNKR